MWNRADQSARWFMRAVGVVASVGLLAYGVSELVTGDWAKGLVWLVASIGVAFMTVWDWSSA